MSEMMLFGVSGTQKLSPAHVIDRLEQMTSEQIADLRSFRTYRNLTDDEFVVAHFACGLKGFPFWYDDCETAQPFCDRCLLADMNPAVYRAFDDFGQLLYVGYTTDLTRRMIAHKHAPWRKYATRVEVDTYVSVKAARKAEVEEIAERHPLFNRASLPLPILTSEVGR